MVKDVRGLGLMWAIEFGPPSGRASRGLWNAVERRQAGLFSQLITVPLFTEHRIFCQVAGHRMNTIKALPALVIEEARSGGLPRRSRKPWPRPSATRRRCCGWVCAWRRARCAPERRAAPRPGRVARYPVRRARTERGHPQRGDHRARRPWQDHAGRRDAVAVRRVQGRSGGGDAGARLDGPRAREGHHDHVEEHSAALWRGQAEHRRYAGARGLRRRGRARPDDGGRRAAAGGRLRGSAAADAVRAAQGARGAPAGDPGRQQGRSLRRPRRRGGRRGVRAVPRPRRRREPDRVSDRLLQRQGGAGHRSSTTPRRGSRRMPTSRRCSTCCSSGSRRRCTTPSTRCRRS